MREAVVSELSRDRGVHTCSQWQGAFWRLISSTRSGRTAAGTTRSKVEAVAWGDLAGAVLTEQALDALGAAGRL